MNPVVRDFTNDWTRNRVTVSLDICFFTFAPDGLTVIAIRVGLVEALGNYATVPTIEQQSFWSS